MLEFDKLKKKSTKGQFLVDFNRATMYSIHCIHLLKSDVCTTRLSAKWIFKLLYISTKKSISGFKNRTMFGEQCSLNIFVSSLHSEGDIFFLFENLILKSNFDDRIWIGGLCIWYYLYKNNLQVKKWQF